MNKMNNAKLTIHRASSRGGGDYGWLKTFYSFSFADWYNPERMGFGVLRVINDDVIAEAMGFGTHSHANMEIISIVTKGTLAHKDSTGSVGSLTPGMVQVMSAGSGVRHSEYNGGAGEAKLFQIWIETNKHNAEPRYDERKFDASEGERLLVSPMGNPDALNIHQDAYITRFTYKGKHTGEYQLKNKEHGVYFFVIEGEMKIAEEKFDKRDAVGVEGVSHVEFSTHDGVDMIAIEVPMK